MKLFEMLADQPAVKSMDRARAEIREHSASLCKCLAVIDDDPTGTQTVHDVKVYMKWTSSDLQKAVADGSVFYISTNSRSLDRDQVEHLSYQVGYNLHQAAKAHGVGVALASRSDSTLRGHFPYELDALMAGLGQHPDGIILAPAFFEAGRYTISDIHWVEQDGEMVPAHQTEFAKDPTFGFSNSDLKQWVEEKTSGKVTACDVASISLETIRCGGPEAVAAQLASISGGRPVILNAACYEDLEVAVMGLVKAEALGKVFAYRCAASFVKVRGGIEDRPLLGHSELLSADGPGLIVVGSYVAKTSRQLKRLLNDGSVTGVELDVDAVLDDQDGDAEVSRVSEKVNTLLGSGASVALYTSRSTHLTQQDGFLQLGEKIMSALCETVGRVKTRPSFFIAKGGITSIEMARTVLGISEGLVLGQILPGVPVWKLGPEARWPGMPYVVFPGNVGGEDALSKAVSILSAEAIH